MLRVLTRLSAILLLALACLGAGAAAADSGSALAASATRPGVIDLFFTGPPGTNVAFFERVDDAYESLGTETIGMYGRVVLVDATTWRCDRLTRDFFAVGVAPDGSTSHGSFSVRTGSCKHRFELAAPRRVAVGAKAHVRVIDNWGIGGTAPQLCIARPHAQAACRVLRFRKAVTVLSRNFRATTAGQWRIALLIEGARISTSVAVGKGGKAAPAPPPTLLATGDSTMQSVDSFLADGLADKANVLSDAIPGSGISETSTFWLHHAASQVAHLHPTTTVVSIGANDSYTMKTPDGDSVVCCDAPWVAEYSRRVRAMMRTYIQHGHGRVLWLALPLARDPLRASINVKVNSAIRSAAADLDGAYVVGLDAVFTPTGYADVIRWRGQNVDVRAADGIHLNVAGASIAAGVVESLLDDLDAE